MVNDFSSLVDIDLEDYQEPQVIRDNNIYTLRILSCEKKDIITKDGKERSVLEMLLRVTDSGLINPKPIRYSLWVPDPKYDTPEQLNAAKGKIIRFNKAIGYDGKGFDTSVAYNAEIRATLKVLRDDIYGESNVIRNIIV
jgi:hypothetical protein